MVNKVPFNLKLTQGNSADNAWQKKGTVFTFTGTVGTINDKSNINDFMENVIRKCKTVRNRTTEYHYLVVNKDNGKIICKSLLDIHTYHSNPSNMMQIKWCNEFKHANYVCEDHTKKMHDLMRILQRSVTQNRENEILLHDWDGVL